MLMGSMPGWYRSADPRSPGRPAASAPGSRRARRAAASRASPVASPVSTGGSSETSATALPAMLTRAIRSGGGGLRPAFGCGSGGESHLHRRPAKSPPRGMNADRALADRELAGLLDAGAFGVADIVQSRDQLARADHLAGIEGERPREHARDDTVALAVQARLDDARELDVVVAEHPRSGRDRRTRQVERAAASAGGGGAGTSTTSARRAADSGESVSRDAASRWLCRSS